MSICMCVCVLHDHKSKLRVITHRPSMNPGHLGREEEQDVDFQFVGMYGVLPQKYEWLLEHENEIP